MQFIRFHFLFFTFLCIFVGFLSVYFEPILNQVSLMVANTEENMTYYQGKSEEIYRYNEAIFMAKKGDYLAAESLISPLINIKNLTSPSDVYELYGDVLYSLKKPPSVTETYYTRSLEFGSGNLRVEKKLALLHEYSDASSLSGTIDTQTGKMNTPQTYSGASEKSDTLQFLNKISSDRGTYMRYNTSPELDQASLIKSSLDILEGGQEKHDW